MHFESDSVTCTPEHPFFVDNEWVQAKELQAGDLLLNANGESVSVTSVLQYSTDTATTVYNLEAAANHNFYVSASGVLVHNCENLVYVSRNADGTIIYVGITNDLARRAAEHLASKGIIIRQLLPSLSRSDARAVEEALIVIHGLEKNGGTLINKIHSISKRNPFYGQQLQRGYELLQSIGYTE